MVVDSLFMIIRAVTPNLLSDVIKALTTSAIGRVVSVVIRGIRDPRFYFVMGGYCLCRYRCLGSR